MAEKAIGAAEQRQRDSATEQQQFDSATVRQANRTAKQQNSTETRWQTGLSIHFGERAEAGVRNTRIRLVTGGTGW
jgi:hypothetical protein